MPLVKPDKLDARDKIVMRSVVVDGCWVWLGRKHNMGYGRMTFRGNPDFLAHRVAFIVWNGEIPDGLELDHLCRNRRCVNPAHLEAVTHVVNVRRGGRMLKDHCPQGHPYDEVKSSGHRGCSVCRKEHQRKAEKNRNKEQRRRYMKAWHERNPGKQAEYRRRSLQRRGA